MNKNLLLIESSDGSSTYDMGLSFFENLCDFTDFHVEKLNANYLFKKASIRELGEYLVNFAKNKEFGYIFFTLDHRVLILEKHLALLRQSGVKLICYIGDDEHYCNMIYNSYCQYFDLILVGNYFPAQKYRAMGLNAIFFPSVFRDYASDFKKNPAYKYDLSFVGNTADKVDRQFYLASLEKHGYRVKIFGSGSDAGVLSREEMLEVFQQTKINLNFTGISRTNPYDQNFKSQRRFRQIKGRCQEIALSGGFFLTEYAHGFEHLFPADIQPYTFSNQNELVKLVDKLIKNDRERERTRANLYSYAKLNFIAEVGWRRAEKEILKISSIKCLDKLEFDTVYYKTLNTQSLYRSLIFLLKLKLKPFLFELQNIKIKNGFNIKIMKSFVRRGFKSKSQNASQ